MEEEAPGAERNHGEQPLEELMKRWNLTNHDLVAISTEQLTHKQVQKARQGRQLTLKMMQKVCRALNVAIWEKAYSGTEGAILRVHAQARVQLRQGV